MKLKSWIGCQRVFCMCGKRSMGGWKLHTV